MLQSCSDVIGSCQFVDLHIQESRSETWCKDLHIYAAGDCNQGRCTRRLQGQCMLFTFKLAIGLRLDVHKRHYRLASRENGPVLNERESDSPEWYQRQEQGL